MWGLATAALAYCVFKTWCRFKVELFSLLLRFCEETRMSSAGRALFYAITQRLGATVCVNLALLKAILC